MAVEKEAARSPSLPCWGSSRGRDKIEAMGHPVVALFTKKDLLGDHAQSHQPAGLRLRGMVQQGLHEENLTSRSRMQTRWPRTARGAAFLTLKKHLQRMAETLESGAIEVSRFEDCVRHFERHPCFCKNSFRKLVTSMNSKICSHARCEPKSVPVLSAA